MSSIGIMGAMHEEVVLYHKALEKKSERSIAGLVFLQGKLDKKDVVLVQSGVGKVQAAVCTQLLIDHFGVSAIVFTGVAGALRPDINILDMVISRDSVQHDLDVAMLGCARGQIPFTDLRFFPASEKLRQDALRAARSLGLPVHEGRILTGDQFITEEKKAQALRDELGGDCVDMEGASMAHVCTLNNVPHVIIKSISDKADHTASMDFCEFSRKASQRSYTLVREMLRQYEE